MTIFHSRGKKGTPEAAGRSEGKEDPKKQTDRRKGNTISTLTKEKRDSEALCRILLGRKKEEKRSLLRKMKGGESCRRVSACKEYPA